MISWRSVVVPAAVAVVIGASSIPFTASSYYDSEQLGGTSGAGTWCDEPVSPGSSPASGTEPGCGAPEDTPHAGSHPHAPEQSPASRPDEPAETAPPRDPPTSEPSATAPAPAPPAPPGPTVAEPEAPDADDPPPVTPAQDPPPVEPTASPVAVPEQSDGAVAGD